MNITAMKPNRRILTAGMHVLGWAIILLIPRYLMHQTWFKINLLHDFSLWIPIIIVFYINFYILVPKLLANRKFTLYALSLVLIITASFFFIRLVDHYYFETRFFPPVVEKGMMLNPSLQPSPVDKLSPTDSLAYEAREKDHGHLRAMRREIDVFVLLVLAIAISTSIKITGKWYSNEKERKDMENQKLSAELSLLKSQINPHFFFNTLNSIYSLAIQKSGKTPEAIVKLSELMRYIIYESDKTVVPLKKELEYIRNYVELQRLRLMSNVKVSYHIEGMYNDVMVEPLLFLPFIENAFKHGIDYTKDCEIKIKFVINSERLLFRVENALVPKSKREPSDSSGIGLANTKKRLELLYADKYELNVNQTDGLFIVELALNIREHELYHS